MIAPYYQDEFATLYHGDVLAVLAELPARSVSTIFTDPPYSSGARNSAALRTRGAMQRAKPGQTWFGSDNLTSHGFAMLVRLFAAEALRVSVVGGHMFSFIDWRQWPVLAGATEAAGWTIRACLVWDKKSFGMGNGFRQQAEFVLHASLGTADNFERHDLGTVFRCARENDSEHPTMKPLALVRELLSAVPDGVVLDPFAGSGSTLRAAKDLGRKSIGVEISERYCEIAANRLRQGVLFG